MNQQEMRIAILGAGGLGRNALKVIAMKEGVRCTAICDRSGIAVSESGLAPEILEEAPPAEAVAGILEVGRPESDPVAAMIEARQAYDGILVTLPNLPNEFIPSVVQRFCEGGFQGSFVDALKRTQAMDLMFKMNHRVRDSQCVYLTGCGATPGLLSAAAVLAAQSFAEVEHVDIWWGVGIPSWDSYRATIREDIAHLPGYDVEKAKALTDEEVDQLLDKTEGKLILRNMEHADDVLLQKVHVVRDRDQVTVGGVMDTRHAKKPVSTTMTLTGVTFEGKRSMHRFVLGDETSMAANVLGPMLGYLKRAEWLRERGIYGVFGSTEFMPIPLAGRVPESMEITGAESAVSHSRGQG